MKQKHLDLPEKTIHIWYCNFDLNNDKIDYYNSLLSNDEKQKAARFKFEKDKICNIITRGILRLLLAGYLKMNPEDINFKYTSFKKPYLAFENQLQFNVSHSGTMAAFAFFNGSEIGVDIEKIKDDFNVMNIAENFFSHKEIQALSKLNDSEKNKAFYRCWTRKESFIKAEGSGLSFPLNKFTVSLDKDDHAELLNTSWDESEKDNWSIFSSTPADSYIGAIAVRSKVKAIKFFLF